MYRGAFVAKNEHALCLSFSSTQTVRAAAREKVPFNPARFEALTLASRHIRFHGNRGLSLWKVLVANQGLFAVEKATNWAQSSTRTAGTWRNKLHAEKRGRTTCDRGN